MTKKTRKILNDPFLDCDDDDGGGGGGDVQDVNDVHHAPVAAPRLLPGPCFET